MESRNWRPSRWTQEAIRRRMRRAYKYALREMELMIGPHEARIVFAELVGRVKSEQSRIELQRRGVPLIGDSLSGIS